MWYDRRWSINPNMMDLPTDMNSVSCYSLHCRPYRKRTLPSHRSFVVGALMRRGSPLSHVFHPILFLHIITHKNWTAWFAHRAPLAGLPIVEISQIAGNNATCDDGLTHQPNYFNTELPNVVKKIMQNLQMLG